MSRSDEDEDLLLCLGYWSSFININFPKLLSDGVVVLAHKIIFAHRKEALNCNIEWDDGVILDELIVPDLLTRKSNFSQDLPQQGEFIIKIS